MARCSEFGQEKRGREEEGSEWHGGWSCHGGFYEAMGESGKPYLYKK